MFAFGNADLLCGVWDSLQVLQCQTSPFGHMFGHMQPSAQHEQLFNKYMTKNRLFAYEPIFKIVFTARIC